MTRLLIVSHDVVDERMAGPGIRYWEMACALSRTLTVTLATPGTILPVQGFGAHVYVQGDWETLAPAVSRADAVLCSGDLLIPFPQLATCSKPLIIDASFPYTFETLHLGASLSREQQTAGYQGRLETMRRAALAGDFFFCASDRQRNYWLGVLDTVGRINPDTYVADNSFYHFIDVVPFGLPSRPSEPTAPVIKGVIPGIGPLDRVVLWGGGLWQWLDPLTLVSAVARVVEKMPDVRLVFPGTRHPNPVVPDMPMHRETVELSDRLGLTSKVIFFGDWVPYEHWLNYPLEADIGASLHFDTLETHFAFRTRVLDYIWAGLPMVVTAGDSTSELVRRYGLGEVVPPGDARAVATAIQRLLDTPDLKQSYRQKFDQVRSQFSWERACRPIIRFCGAPTLAPDRMAGTIARDWIEPATLAERDLEIEGLRDLVNRYENGRFMRLMRRWHGWRERLGF